MARSLTAVFAGFCLSLPTLLVLIPKAMVPLLLATGALAAVMVWRGGGRPAWPGRPLWLCLGALLAWALIACVWTFDPLNSLFLVLRLSSLILCGLFLIAVAGGLDDEARRTLRPAILAGFAIAVAVVVFERALGQPIYTTFGHPDGKHTLLSIMNRGATGLAMLVWPVAALLSRGRAGRWALLLPPGLFVVLLFLDSAAALLGLALGGLIALVAWRHARLGQLVLAAVVVVTFGTAPFAARWFQDGDLQQAHGFDSARHRMEIWSFSAERIADKPLFGWGFDSAHDMVGAGIVPSDPELGTAMPGHPHNAVLQIWLELGGVGAAIALALLLVVIRRLDRLPPLEFATAQASFMTSFTIALVSYGIWQHQWIGMLLAAALMVILIRGPTRERAAGAAPAPSQGA